MVWEASKGVGQIVEADLKELVKLRNQVAKGLGFLKDDALRASSQRAEPGRGDRPVRRTGRPDPRAFLKAKAEIDTRPANNYGIGALRDLALACP